jgi:pimeloyl-ACP methyl ester carboxylesterase
MSRPTLLCLHGWGASQESFTELRDALKGEDIEILSPDLPGFGKEQEPTADWTLDDYANWVEEYIRTHIREKSFSLLGHSFGGRIAIKIASGYNKKPKTYTLEHLYLCASAGIKRHRHVKRSIGLIIAKTGKAILSLPGLNIFESLAKRLLYKLLRVHDYERASPRMQQIMINVCKEDLRPLLKDIDTQTVIFWGERDTMTPIQDAHVMDAEIPHSTLHTYPDVRHRVHRDMAQEIAEVIRKNLITPHP